VDHGSVDTVARLYCEMFSTNTSRGNETADQLARCGCALGFIGPELALGSVGRISGIRSFACWGTSIGGAGQILVIPKYRLVNLTRDHVGVPRLGFYPSIGSNPVLSRDFLPGHNTLRRHLHLTGLTDNPLCRKCGADDETSAHIVCRCGALTSLRHTHFVSFFLEL
jgi:hypothetical protein